MLHVHALGFVKRGALVLTRAFFSGVTQKAVAVVAIVALQTSSAIDLACKDFVRKKRFFCHMGGQISALSITRLLLNCFVDEYKMSGIGAVKFIAICCFGLKISESLNHRHNKIAINNAQNVKNKQSTLAKLDNVFDKKKLSLSCDARTQYVKEANKKIIDRNNENLKMRNDCQKKLCEILEKTEKFIQKAYSACKKQLFSDLDARIIEMHKKLSQKWRRWQETLRTAQKTEESEKNMQKIYKEFYMWKRNNKLREEALIKIFEKKQKQEMRNDGEGNSLESSFNKWKKDQKNFNQMHRLLKIQKKFFYEKNACVQKINEKIKYYEEKIPEMDDAHDLIEFLSKRPLLLDRILLPQKPQPFFVCNLDAQINQSLRKLYLLELKYEMKRENLLKKIQEHRKTINSSGLIKHSKKAGILKKLKMPYKKDGKDKRGGCCGISFWN